MKNTGLLILLGSFLLLMGAVYDVQRAKSELADIEVLHKAASDGVIEVERLQMEGREQVKKAQNVIAEYRNMIQQPNKLAVDSDGYFKGIPTDNGKPFDTTGKTDYVLHAVEPRGAFKIEYDGKNPVEGEIKNNIIKRSETPLKTLTRMGGNDFHIIKLDCIDTDGKPTISMRDSDINDGTLKGAVVSGSKDQHCTAEISF